jgi:hypothetical protein
MANKKNDLLKTEEWDDVEWEDAADDENVDELLKQLESEVEKI